MSTHWCLSSIWEGAGWSCQAPPKPQHRRNSSQQSGLPLSRYGSPGLPSCRRANPSRQPGRPDFLQFPRHLFWLPNKLPLCPLSPGCECLCCGDRSCHPLSSGYGANTGWASVGFTISSLRLSAKSSRGTPPAAGPTAPLTAHLLSPC